MLKIGVIGAGHLGKIHLNILKETPEFQLIGFYDAVVQTCEAVSKQCKVKAYQDLDALIESCDVLNIITPTVSHFEIAKKCLKQGKHLFIEKPITSTLEEAKKLIELSYEAGTKVQIGHVERFNPAFLAAKPHLEKPIFIEMQRLSQYNPRGTDVSVILDLMIHDIDILLHVVKSPIKRISATGVSVISNSPDICNARIEFDNGCAANLTASRISSKNIRKSRFFEHNKYILVDYLDKKAKIYDLVDLQEQTLENTMIETLDPWLSNSKRLIKTTPQVHHYNAIQEELKALASSILNNKPTQVSAQEGYHALEVATRIMDKMNFQQQAHKLV